MSDLRLYLFGTPRVEYQGHSVKIERRKALALAAYLALVDSPQSRDVIAGLLWPDLDAEHARSALRSTLRALTTAIPVEWIQADRMSMALKRDAVWVDVNAFIGFLSQSDSHGHDFDTVCDDCVVAYKRAIDLYRGEFLAGLTLSDSVDYDHWQLMQREWLRREFADIEERLSRYYAQAQQYDQAIKHAQQWLSTDMLHEPAHRQLMRLYAANGQRTEALRQYRQCVEILDEELATPPENETIQLYQSIKDDQFTLSDTSGREAPPSFGVMPPLPAVVIGREQALSDIKTRLGIGGAEARAVTVIQGWPGVGKSTTMAMLAHDSDVAQQYPDGILWASLGETPNLLSEISAWAKAMNLGEAGASPQMEEISAQLTAVLRDKRVLLILDDVWLPDHAAPFRVGGARCALVVTTRLNDVATALAPSSGDIYRLPVLSEAASLELLANLIPETVTDYREEARLLVADLEGLPLAIHVAGRLLQSEARLGWGIRDLLDELRTGVALLQAQLPSDRIGARRDTSPTIATLLKRSTDLLDEETRQRFAVLGLFVPKPATFDLQAMAVAWEVTDPRPIARLLVSRGLLEPVSGGRFQMHALLVLHARSLLEEEGLQL